MTPTWWIGPTAAALALPLVYGLLRLLFPSRAPTSGERTRGELQEEFGKWIKTGVVLWLLVTPVASYFCWKRLRVWGAQIAAELPDATYASVPNLVTWALPAALFGMLASAVVLDALFRLLLFRRHREFVRYQELELGFSESATLPLLAILCAAGALFIAAIGDWYVLVTPDESIIDEFLGFSEERYPHANVVEVRTAPVIKAPLGSRKRRISAIRYTDDRSWMIDTTPGPVSDDEILEITRYISRRSGVEAREVESISRELF